MCQHVWDPCQFETQTEALEKPLSPQGPGRLQAEMGHLSPYKFTQPQTPCWARNMSRADPAPAPALEPSSPVENMESHQSAVQNVL